VLARIMDAPIPVVCKLNGPARAGGIGLVAACDIAIAPRSATFAFTEVRIGVVPAIIAVPIIRRVRPRAISRWFLTGATFTADQAAADGLVTIATDDVEATCEEILSAFRRCEPAALSRTKAIVDELGALDLMEGFELAAAVSARFFASEAAQEGMAAFAEKRDPRWAL
jgi:methylglutaconyl-CoA hydratase